MRAVVQRVTDARVEVAGDIVGEIGAGFLVLLGVARDDTTEDADYLSDKSVKLRVFNDDEGKMNLSLLETGGAMLVVSQFTLYGDVRRGRRPSYSEAAEPEKANQLYKYFVERVRSRRDCRDRCFPGNDEGEPHQRRPGHGVARQSKGVLTLKTGKAAAEVVSRCLFVQAGFFSSFSSLSSRSL